MSRFFRLILVFVFVVAALPVAPALAADPPVNYDEVNCTNGLHGVYGPPGVLGNASFCIVVPPDWNHDLVIFAHGYVDPTFVDPDFPNLVGIPYEQLMLPDGTTSIPGLVLNLGFAFAITSYSKKGLAVEQGVADVVALANLFKAQRPDTNHIYLIGASEGGLVTTLAIEQNPGNIFKGGVATCGPVGDFQKQVNYWGDFRVIFDYFFRNPAGGTLLPNNPVDVSPLLFEQWRPISEPAWDP